LKDEKQDFKREKNNIKYKAMKTIYRITSIEMGTILLKRRKIAKALRWWMRENGVSYTHTYFFS
jgi:hypothetical protein